MTKREFLRGLAVGAAALTARPAVALAERIRILPADSDVGPIPTGMVSPELQRLVTSVRVGEARAHGALLVFWLHAVTTAPPLAVATLEEARSRGDLVITEREQATVPSLVVENRGKIHALLLAGEILLGGKQNRVVTEDILLPPLSGPLTITVYCVEQGGWRGRAQHFESKGSFARQWPKLLRAHALEAYGRHSEADGWEGRLRQSVQSLLQNVAKTEGTLRRNAGAGRLFEFRVDGSRGAALVAEAQVVHAACL